MRKKGYVISMKKFFSVIVCALMIATMFVACSTNSEDATTTSSTAKTTVKYTTDDAVIAEADAVNLIKSYSAKELGLSDDEYEECSFMVANSGELIDETYYIKVVAAIKTEHENDDGEVTYTFDNKGEYYISYDGKQILQKDMSSEKDKYSEMEVKAVPTTKASTTETTTEK
jgi:hypothetical protein